MRRIYLLWISLLTHSIQMAWSQAYNLEATLAAPYCAELCVSDNGQRIAWTVEERGVRSVYTADSPDFVPYVRFQSNDDDGQVIGNLDFDHLGQNLYFVRGSATNRNGEIANPSSQVRYPVKILYRFDLRANILDTIGEYAGYVISPDDQYLLLLQGNKLLKYTLQNHEKEQLIQMRGTFSDVAFRPDSHAILFVSNRGDHSFIGMYEFGRNSIDWIAPSLHRDQSPVWSPDGEKLAFIRVPGQQRGELADITGGNPFSIVVYDLNSHQEDVVWTSPADDGGFAQYYHEHPLRWTDNGNLLFYSEHEDYMNLYRLNIGTGILSALITGACEVEHSDVSSTGHQVVFSSNCGDIDRRHLFTYDLESEQLMSLTQGNLIETNPHYLRPDLVVYRESGYNFPTRIAIMDRGKKKIVFPKELPEEYPENNLVVPRQVILKAADGTEIHGQLFTKDESGKKPGILFMHGGPIRQMLLGYHYSSYYANAYVLNQFLAAQGYAVLSVNYRAGIGYGRDFRRAKNQGPRGASEYQDIIAAAKYLQNLGYVDPEKIGLWGGSYGGLLTAQGLARNSDLFKAGVDFHGVHDWSWRATDFSKGGFWGIDEHLMELAYQSSPVSELTGWRSPVLLIHGDDDRNVMFGQSIDLAEKLKNQGVHYEVLVLPDEVHGFYRYESWLRSYQATVDFFERFLKN